MRQRQTGSAALRLALATALTAVASLIGCRSEEEKLSQDTGQSPKIELTSTAFAHGQPIPKKYTADGEDVSPPLAWSALPEGTKELALICDDPDAPAGTWVHWVIYKVPATATGLPEGIAEEERLKQPAGVLQGKNSWSSGQTIGYRGPKPPSGTHRYFFKLYGLDSQLQLEPGLDKQSLLDAMDGHILAEGELMGTYER